MATAVLQSKKTLILTPWKKWSSTKYRKESMYFVCCVDPFDQPWWAFWIPGVEVKGSPLARSKLPLPMPSAAERMKHIWMVYQQRESVLYSLKAKMHDYRLSQLCFVCGFAISTWPTTAEDIPSFGYYCTKCLVGWHQECVSELHVQFPTFWVATQKTFAPTIRFGCPPHFCCSGCLMYRFLKLPALFPYFKGKNFITLESYLFFSL